jgi:ABC-type taurine transport system substrate-binding protein
MYADSLHCKNAAIYNESVGVVNINASDNIDAFIRGPGNIGYYGTPVINIVEKRGTGKIIRLD